MKSSGVTTNGLTAPPPLHSDWSGVRVGGVCQQFIVVASGNSVSIKFWNQTLRIFKTLFKESQ